MTTPIPLTILVDEDWLERPEVKDLEAKGHTILTVSTAYDLVLSRRAHWWHDPFWEIKSLFQDVIKSARDEKKRHLPPKPKRGRPRKT